MNLYISKKDAQYLIDLIEYDLENTTQTEDLRERGQDLKGYLEGMLADQGRATFPFFYFTLFGQAERKRLRNITLFRHSANVYEISNCKRLRNVSFFRQSKNCKFT